MTDKKKLDNFQPDELEEIKNRLSSLENTVAPLTDNIKKFGEQLKAAQTLFDQVHIDVETIREGARYDEIATAIRELTEKIGTSQPLVEAMKPTTLDFSKIPNLEKLDIDSTKTPITIRPKEFLADLWGSTNDAIKDLGGQWIRDGQNSRWEIGGAIASTQPQKTQRTIKNPDAPATTKQIAWLENQKIFVKDGLTKGEASKLIQRRMNELDAKKKA